MIPLLGRGRRLTGTGPVPAPLVRRVTMAPSSDAEVDDVIGLIPPGGGTPPAKDVVLTFDPSWTGAEGSTTILLPPPLTHLGEGDVVMLSADGSRLTVLWKVSARHNSLLLTEQCDHHCVMCSQPPRPGADEWLFDRAERVVRLLPRDTTQVGLTGGEPTLHPRRLLRLLRLLASRLPDTQVHLLSNGRRFADPRFLREYLDIGHDGLMVGIPVYAADPDLHDWVVQAEGAFDETVRGLVALGGGGARIELRVVVQAANAAHLPRLAAFIARNLPFVEQVALMGLEMVGLARPNASQVWIDPADYREELREAVEVLATSGVRTLVFNHPLCVVDPWVRGFAVPSISDWKAGHVPACRTCDLVGECGGVFTTSGTRVSAHLAPVRVTPNGVMARVSG